MRRLGITQLGHYSVVLFEAVVRTADLAYITPDVLRWARERSHLDVAELAKLAKVSEGQVAAWEKSQGHPTFTKAQHLARLLRIPFGYLFLASHPIEDTPLPDFRKLDPDDKRLTPDFKELLNIVLTQRDWYREYAEDNQLPVLKFVGQYRGVTDHHLVAQSIISALDMSAQVRSSFSNWFGYRRYLVDKIEALGVLVMRAGYVGHTKRKLGVREFRGFSLVDKYAPVVFVNASDAQSAQIFSLIHEFAHILIGEGGISNPDPSTLDEGGIEEFCNRAAVEALIPRREFLALWNQHADHYQQVQKLARLFHVSGLVVLRRAFDLDRLERDEFFEYVRREKKKQLSQASGGNYYRTMTARNGRRLIKAVFADLDAGRLLHRDAARLLGVGIPNLGKLREQASD